MTMSRRKIYVLEDGTIIFVPTWTLIYKLQYKLIRTMVTYIPLYL
jgi:hypothetical protein